MQFTVLQENLKAALRILTKAVPSKPQLPILSTVLCKVGDGEVVLSATDLYLGVTVRVPASIEQEGTLAIPGRTLIDTINSLSAGKVTLTNQNQSLVIQSTSTKTTIQCLPSDDFPAFPDKAGTAFTLSLESLQKIDEKLSFSVSTDQARLVLTTLLFQPVEAATEIVATDGFRLGKIVVPDSEVKVDEPLLIPAQAISEVVKIADQQGQKKIEITLSKEQKQLFFAIEDTTLYVRLVEGQYPPYQKIFPTEFATEVEVDGGALLEHLKQAQVMAREVSNVISFQISEGKLTTSVAGAAQGTFTATLDQVKQTGPDTTIAFNSRYLLDFLTKLKPEQLYFGLNDPLKPALFRDLAEPSYSYVVMPFRVNQA
jgi:DNA polymerase III subunit beta